MTDGTKRRMPTWAVVLLTLLVALVVLFLVLVTLVYIECNDDSGFSCGG